MNTAMRLFGLGVSICMLTIFAGCAVQQPNLATEPQETGRTGDGVVYRPKVQPGQTGTTNAQALTSELKSQLFGKCFIMDPAHPNVWIVIESSTVYNDRMAMETNFVVNNRKVAPVLHYYRLLRPTLAVENNYEKTNFYKISYQIRLPNSFRLGFENLPSAQRVADALFFIQRDLRKLEEQQEQKLALFGPKAAEYRALKTKPPMSEEMRRLVVQANAMNQQKKYGEAIGEYLKVIDLDPVSFPAAYFNLALLSAQLNRPLSATFYMKYYLLLAPEAPDARSAQDKIYEWEFMMKN